ncbi:MAG: hypothetical protein Q7S03_02085 [bacterium]|nr:hypothetical protein [bacterium]
MPGESGDLPPMRPESEIGQGRASVETTVKKAVSGTMPERKPQTEAEIPDFIKKRIERGNSLPLVQAPKAPEMPQAALVAEAALGTESERPPQRLEFRPIAGGAGAWLIEKEDLDRIENAQFRRLLGVIESTPPDLTSVDILQKRAFQIGDLIAAGEITTEQAKTYLTKIAAKVNGLGKKEKSKDKEWSLDDLSTDENEQRARIREFLEKLESTNRPITRANSELVSELEANFHKMSPEVEAEARARIRLHECYTRIAAISGDAEQAGKDLANFATEAAAAGHVLEGEDFKTLLKNGLPGLKIADAFTKLQDWAMNGQIVRDERGREVLNERGEVKRVRYRQKGSAMAEQQRIERDLIGGLGLGREEAVKSYQLAQRLAVTTFEASVWNTEMVGKDFLAENIYFRGYRKGRDAAQRDRGPKITIDLIPGFGSSFFRTAKIFNGDRLVARRALTPDERREILENKEGSEELTARKRLREGTGGFKGLANQLSNMGLRLNPIKEDDREIEGKYLKARESLHQQGAGVTGELTTSLSFKDLPFEGLTEGAYSVYVGITLPRLIGARELLLKTDFKSGEVGEDDVRKWIARFNDADPDGSLELRRWFVTGLLDAGLTQGVRLGWGQDAVKSVRKAFSEHLGGEKVIGVEKKDSFLPKEVMDRILVDLDVYRRAAQVDFSLGLTGVLRTRR